MLNEIPFNDTSRIFKKFESELLPQIQQVSASGWWLLGEHTKRFEQSFAQYCGVKSCIALANGTDALEIALKAVAGDKGDRSMVEVITVANAGGYSATGCRLAGVIPVYADIEAHNQLIDINSLVRCLGPRVKAVVITHLYGAAVDVIAVRKAIDDAGYSHVRIIEDCAQAHGAKVNGHRVGSMGDVATFSFYPTKNLGAMGDAGAVVTNDDDIFKQMKALHQYGWSGKYRIDTADGRNSRMDELQAAILNVFLPHLDECNAIRQQIWKRYTQAAKGKISFLNYDNNDFVGHLAIAKVERKADFIQFMALENIAVDVHYPILDVDQLAWKELIMRVDEQSDLSVSRESVSKIVSLPLFPFMTEDEIKRVCNAIVKWESM